ncbi:NAD(P)-binding protein [Zopfia rhizophila CBS 207.26]|uniref:NAD(P)-binding protein n=1 Tax=Zopfia rhizophila CBS 207.26 TaxID=1314779 RepID=A0A6A6E0T5_9PEZI|nr:NAD(P)-binding protein [Zopfia rhizophila CBS 207.26]
MAPSSPPIPPTMKAWTFSKAGPHRKVLTLTPNLPTPAAPTGNQVLIKIAYSGLNPADTKVMNIIPTFLRKSVSIPGMDFSGTIIGAGPSAPENLKVGTKVFGALPRKAPFAGYGTLCEYICISTTGLAIASVPENVSMEEAAGMAIAGIVTFLICKYGGINEGNGYRVLVNGASGGCGSMFVQGVLAMGAKEVVGTCSAPNVEMVKSLGASRVIDYRANAPVQKFLAKEYGTRPFDVVVDTVGAQKIYTHSPAFLKESGVFVNIGGYTDGTAWTLWHWFINYFWPSWLGGTPRKYVMFSGSPDQESMEKLVKYVGEGKMTTVVEKVYEMDQLLEAFDLLNTKRVRGKLVVKVGGD